jgi:hypothetical protein
MSAKIRWLVPLMGLALLSTSQATFAQREPKERAGMQRAERAVKETSAAKEAKERADKTAKESKERADRTAREAKARADHAAAEAKASKEAKERADKATREAQAAKEAKERADRATKEAIERASRAAKEAQQAKEAKERADRQHAAKEAGVVGMIKEKIQPFKETLVKAGHPNDISKETQTKMAESVKNLMEGRTHIEVPLSDNKALVIDKQGEKGTIVFQVKF